VTVISWEFVEKNQENYYHMSIILFKSLVFWMNCHLHVRAKPRQKCYLLYLFIWWFIM
jgi:hypothetical protein